MKAHPFGIVPLGALILAALLTPAGAQSVNAPTIPPGKAIGKQLLDTRRNLFFESVPLFINGQGNAAEQRLLSISPFRTGTAAWSYDGGVQLFTMAVYLQAQKQVTASRDACTRALANLQTSATTALAANDKPGAARAYEYMARIYDEFLTDVRHAAEKLAEGARLDPANAKIAREVERLDRSEKTLKPRPNGK